MNAVLALLPLILAAPDADVYARALPAMAWVRAGAEGLGTGWLVDRPRRLLLTCHHVVGEAKAVEVFFPVFDGSTVIVERSYYLQNVDRLRTEGRVTRGVVMKRRSESDLALIELASLPADAVALPLATPMAMPGEPVMAIGCRNDLDQLWLQSTGHIRNGFRSTAGYPWRGQSLSAGASLYAVQLPVTGGDSGAALLDARGHVTGMVAAVFGDPARTCAAISLTELRAFLAESPPEPPPVAESPYNTMIRAVARVENPATSARATAWVVDGEARLLVAPAAVVSPSARVDLLFPRITNSRPVPEADAYRGSTRVRAGVVALDARRNLALLEATMLPPGTKALLPAQAAARPGDRLHAIANPHGLETLWNYTAAVVRQSGRFRVTGAETSSEPPRALVLQAPASAGDAGGPLVDDRGRLVAVLTGKDRPEPEVTYSVDQTEVQAFIDVHQRFRRPSNAADWIARGRLRLRWHMPQAAVADFESALRSDAIAVAAHDGLARAWEMAGDRQRHLATCDDALQKVPATGRPALLASRAWARLALGQLAPALTDAGEALKLDPRCAAAALARAEARRRMKQLTDALADADEAVWLAPNDARGYLIRGTIEADRRSFESAIRDFTRAIELDPLDPEPLRRRAMAHDSFGDPKKAVLDRAAAERLR